MQTAVPENLDDLDIEALEELKGKLHDEFDAALDDDAEVALLTEIADAVDAVKGTLDAKIEAAEKEKAEKEALKARMNGEATDSDDDDTSDDGEAVVPEAQPRVEIDTPAADDGTDDEPVAVEKEKEPVTAAATPPSARAVATRADKPDAPPSDHSPLVITASADVPGMSNGQEIDRKALALAFHARARGLGDSQGRRTPYNVASIATPHAEGALITAETNNPWDVVDDVVRSELEGRDAAALVASGGWCAPSETLYDLFSVVSRDGLLDLPSVTVTRGGIQYPDYVGLSAVDDGLFTWSEANDQTPGSDGDSTKPCIKIPCPTFSECRLGAEGLCVTHGNLMDRAYPEMTTYFVDLVVTAHLHRLSNAQVAAILASATAVTVPSAPSDAAGDILNAIDLQVADYRSEHLMSENVVLDTIFPQWWFGAIRSTMAMRAGVAEMAVSNAQIRDFFTVRNVRPQFLAGYDPIYNTAAATAWPSTSTFVIMPAGGYVYGNGGSIDLGVIRDSTLNETNDFTAAWSEQFYCVLQRGPAAREVTVTTNVDGITGGPAAMPIAA